jgi:hypothetical protein
MTPCVLVCVAGSMRCNNHPSDGSALGCGDFDLMLEDGNTEHNSPSQFRGLQKIQITRHGYQIINDCTRRH